MLSHRDGNYRRNARRLGAAIGAVFVVTLPVAAQSPSVAELSRLPLEDLLNIEITTSTLTDKQLATVPASISVFTRRQIATLPLTYLHELINLVPGFQSFRQAEAGDEYYHAARGHRIGTASREVLILMNGQRFNREVDGAMGVPLLPVDSIEKVEFIRGPGSAIYGSNAFLGIIDITTISHRRFLHAEVGNDGKQRLAFAHHASAGDFSLDFYTSLFQEDGRAYTIRDSFSGAPLQTQDPRQGGQIHLRFYNHNTILDLHYLQRESDDFYVLGNTGNGINHTENRYGSVNLERDWAWRQNLDSTINLRYATASYSPRTVLAAPGELSAISDPASDDPLIASTEQEDQSVEIKWHNDWQWRANHGLQFGLEYRRVDVEPAVAANNFDLRDVVSQTVPVRYYGELRRTTPLSDAVDRLISGIYLQSENTIRDNTDVTVGLRYDHYSDIDNAISPRLSLVQKLNPQHTLKLLYGEAFRAPTTNETALTNNSIFVGNPNLDPETVNTWEAVWQWRTGASLLSTSWFNNRLQDSIVQEFVNNTRTLRNSADTTFTRGLEVEYWRDLNPRWTLQANVSHIYAMDPADFRQADTLASLSLLYQGRQWQFGWTSLYQGERKFASDDMGIRQTLADYWLHSTRLQYALSENYQVKADIKNLTDEEYLTPNQGSSLDQGIPNRGREWWLGLQWVY